MVQPRPMSRFEPAPLADGLGIAPALAEESLMEVDVTAPAPARAHPVAPVPWLSQPQALTPPLAPPVPRPAPHPLAPVPTFPHPPSIQPQNLFLPPPVDLPIDRGTPLDRPVQPLNPVSPPSVPLSARLSSVMPHLEPQPQTRSPETPSPDHPITPGPASSAPTMPPVIMLTKSDVVTRIEPLVTPPTPRRPPPPRQAEIDWSRPADLLPPAPPIINVTIGRIEIRAQISPGAIPRPARPSAPVMDLEKYLELRSGGQL